MACLLRTKEIVVAILVLHSLVFQSSVSGAALNPKERILDKPAWRNVGNGYYYTPAFRFGGFVYQKGYYYLDRRTNRMVRWVPPKPTTVPPKPKPVPSQPKPKPIAAQPKPVTAKPVQNSPTSTSRPPRFTKICMQFRINARNKPCGDLIIANGSAIKLEPHVAQQGDLGLAKKLCCGKTSPTSLRGKCYDWSPFKLASGRVVWSATIIHAKGGGKTKLTETCRPTKVVCFPKVQVSMRVTPCGPRLPQPVSVKMDYKAYYSAASKVTCVGPCPGGNCKQYLRNGSRYKWMPIDMGDGRIAWSAVEKLNTRTDKVEATYAKYGSCTAAAATVEPGVNRANTATRVVNTANGSKCNAECVNKVSELKAVFDATSLKGDYKEKQLTPMYFMLRDTLKVFAIEQGMSRNRQWSQSLLKRGLFVTLVAAVDIATKAKFTPVSIPADKAVGNIKSEWDRSRCGGSQKRTLNTKDSLCDLYRVRTERGYVPFLTLRSTIDVKFTSYNRLFGCVRCGSYRNPARKSVSEWCKCTSAGGFPKTSCDENKLDAAALSTYEQTCPEAKMLRPEQAARTLAKSLSSSVGSSAPYRAAVREEFRKVFTYYGMLPRSSSATKFITEFTEKARRINIALRSSTKATAQLTSFLSSITGIKSANIRSDGAAVNPVCANRRVPIFSEPCGRSTTSFGNSRTDSILAKTVVQEIPSKKTIKRNCRLQDGTRLASVTVWMAVVPTDNIDSKPVYVIRDGRTFSGSCRSQPTATAAPPSQSSRSRGKGPSRGRRRRRSRRRRGRGKGGDDDSVASIFY